MSKPRTIESEVSLSDVMAFLRQVAADVDALKAGKPVRETSTPTPQQQQQQQTSDPCQGWDDDKFREYVKTHKLNLSIKGRWIATATKDGVRAHIRRMPTAPVSTPNGSVMTSNRFGADVSVRERDGVQISSKDAAEALMTHPMRAKVNQITRAEWATIAQMGAYLKYDRIPDGKNDQGKTKYKVVGNEAGGHRPNPGNLNGFDRRQAKTMSRQEPKDRKVWTIYQGCLILVKLEASGFKF